ncbi:uncharacterized protein LOC141790358 [Halichoeres trimaculatus]|uniref:uncharacterized protein LOC141790358 n=1 Tax=Halichoeres trimaculatus TaxID=147232 RepID=UPI003D9DD07C
MEEDLKQYLRSRGVPNEDIMRMERDKVDKAVLSIMTDEQIAKYIISYGDQVAIPFFCQQTKTTTDKETLLQNLRDKIGARKMKSKTRGAPCGPSGPSGHKENEFMARYGNHGGVKTSRRIEIGWLHFSCNEYHQVRTKNGGGTRHATVEKTTVAQILDIGKELFFQGGHSTKGPVEDFNFSVCDFKRNQNLLHETVGDIYEKTKLKLLRFYICTKEASSTDQPSSEVDGHSDDSLSEELLVSIDEGGDLQITEHGPYSDADVSITALQDHGRSSDSDISEQSQHFQRSPVSKRQRARSETVMAQGQQELHPSHSTPMNMKKTHIDLGPESDTNDDDSERVWNRLQPSSDVPDSSFEIIVLNSPGAVDQDALEVDEADTVEWDPEDDFAETDHDYPVVITLNKHNKDGIQENSRLLLQDSPLNSSSQPSPLTLLLSLGSI